MAAVKILSTPSSRPLGSSSPPSCLIWNLVITSFLPFTWRIWLSLLSSWPKVHLNKPLPTFWPLIWHQISLKKPSLKPSLTESDPVKSTLFPTHNYFKISKNSNLISTSDHLSSSLARQSNRLNFNGRQRTESMTASRVFSRTSAKSSPCVL